MICRTGRKPNNVGFSPRRMANPHGEFQMGFPVHRHVLSKICEDKPNMEIFNHLIICKFANKTITPLKIELEEVIEPWFVKPNEKDTYIATCFAKFVRINLTWIYNHLIICKFANKTITPLKMKLEEFIEPGLYNSTKTIHKEQKICGRKFPRN